MYAASDSAALDGCYVAADRFDAFWQLTLRPGTLPPLGSIAEEAGARVTAPDGKPDYISAPQSILASAPGIYEKMMEQLN